MSNLKKIRKTLTSNFYQVDKSFIYNQKLSSDAKILFIAIMDTPPNSDVSLTYYQNKLNLTEYKLKKAVKELKANGYLTNQKHPNGEGFKYTFVVSDYGNLKQQDLKYSMNSSEREKSKITPTLSAKAEKAEKVEVEPKPEPQPQSNITIDEYIVNLPSDILTAITANEADFVDRLSVHSGDSVKQIEVIEQMVGEIKKEVYQFYIANTKGLENTSKRIQKSFKDWLKEEIFTKGNLQQDTTRKFTHLKIQLKPKRIDWETKMLND